MPGVKLGWDRLKKLTGAVKKTGAPGVGDYQYNVPTLWIDQATGYCYLLTDATPGAAVWLLVAVGTVMGVYTGTAVFGGSSGVTVPIGTTLSGTGYNIAITPIANPLYVGPTYVASKTTSSFKVHNLGSDTSTQFDWMLIDTGTSLVVYSGSSTFGGAGSLQTVSIGTTLSGTNYVVAITPTTSAVDIGDFYITNKATGQFQVGNTGLSTSAFDWVLVDRN